MAAARQRRRQRQRGGGSAAAAEASLAAEATAWRKCDFSGSGSTLESAVVAWRRQWQHSVGGGSVMLGEALAAEEIRP